VRADLGVPTIFNTLGPMANPGRVKRQLIGVATVDKAEQVAGVLHELGSERSWVVAGADGLDEVSTSGPSTVFDVGPDGVEQTVVSLSELGIERVELADLAGGGPEENVAIFEAILDGEKGPHRDLVLVNAGAGLVVAGLAPNHQQGVELAAEAVDSGAATEKLAQLRGFAR
jgi:anthranilate phosphoribosyltransferase